MHISTMTPPAIGKRLGMLLTSAVILGLAACTTDPTIGAVDWQHGARRGVVISIYAGDLPSAQGPACLAGLSADQIAGQRFALVRYQHVRLSHTAVAAMPEGLPLRSGDVVELWPADCGAGKLSRVSRILATKPTL